MSSLKNLLLVVFVVACASPSLASAEELTSDKKVDIENLLQITGALSIGKQMSVAVVGQLTQSLRQARSDIPQEVLDVLPEVVGSVLDTNISSFKEAIIPVYHKYFTADEIKQMIRFYSTDLGKKTIQVMPSLLQESMAVGEQWGRSLAPQINEQVRARFKQEGIKI